MINRRKIQTEKQHIVCFSSSY